MGEEHLADSSGKVVEDLIVFAMPALRALTTGEKLTLAFFISQLKVPPNIHPPMTGCH